MQTTLRLNDELFRRAKSHAAAKGISLTKLVEEAVQELLDKPASVPRRKPLRLPVSTASGGLAAGFSTLDEAISAADLVDDQRQAR